LLVEHQQRHACLHGDHREPVPDDVVHLAGYPHAFLQRCPGHQVAPGPLPRGDRDVHEGAERPRQHEPGGPGQPEQDR
jgi:hypothetical protein